MLKIKLIFFILLTMSLGFHAPLPEASAAAGDITAVKTQSEGNNLEHDTDHSNFNSLVQVDSDTYALAYMGVDSDGFISTFTISSDGTTITKVDTLEHDTDRGEYNSLVKVDSDTVALAYQGEDGDGFISTFTISSDGTTITEVTTLEHDDSVLPTDALWNSFVHVDSDTYALAYSGVDDDGFISTFTISSDGTTITKVDTLEHDTIGNSSLHNSLVQVDSDTVALAYHGGTGNNAFISTFTIDSDGNITAVKTQSEGNNLEHDTGVLPTGTDNSFVHVDSDTYALAYEDEGSDGSISTFTISSDGTTITELATLEHDTITVSNSLVKVDSETVALVHGPSNSSPNSITTFTISSDGTTITELATLEHDTTRMSGPSLVQVDSDTYALAYSGEDIDGFISTFTIDTARPHKVGTVSPTSSAVLSWTAPTAGDSAITDYVIQYSTDDSNWTTFDDGVSTGTTATVTGLTGGTTYYFRVAAVNSSGTGDFSSSSSVSVTSSSSVSVTSSSSGGGGNNCDSNGFGNNNSLRVYQVTYNIKTYEVQVQAYSTCGSVSAKMTTPMQQSILGLSTEQPYLDDMITIYSGFLDESDEKFHIAIQNKKHSFTETFYIHDKSITKKYTGSTGYTSEQQGTALPTITSEQITVVSEPSVTQVVQTIDESIPIEEQILDEPLETPQIQSITYTHEPIVEEEIKPQCGVGTKLVDGICKIIKTDEPKFCFLFWCW